MKHSSDFQEALFYKSVDEALERVRTILDSTRHPCLAHEEDHKYDDKFALAEFLVNTGNAAKLNALECLGLNTDKFQKVSKWVYEDKKSVTLRFEAEDTCSFLKEKIIELDRDTGYEIETTKTKTGSFLGLKDSTTTETVKTKVITKVKQHHWRVCLCWRLLVFKGSDPNAKKSSVELDSRSSSTILITLAGQDTGLQTSKNPHSPIPSRTVHPAIDINLTWLFRQISPKDQLCQFYIDRISEDAETTCKTPRRNKDVEKAVQFDKKLHAWANHVVDFFIFTIESRITGQHRSNPSISDVDHSALPSLISVSDDTIFVPIIPLMEKGSVLSMGDVDAFLGEQVRSFNKSIFDISKPFPPRKHVALVSVAEATIVLASQHLKSLTRQCNQGLDYVEDMLTQQLIKAIGKEVSSEDFDEFMRFHHQKFFASDFAPRPFTYAIRRPNHFPDGILSIERNASNLVESDQIEPIETWVRHVAGASRPPLLLPISAATTVQLGGDCFLHGWMQHKFELSQEPPSFHLVARARQFSSFLLIVGTMLGPNKVDPKAAIILQNKDEVLIPLMTRILPSAKEFKDAISSLSPEQQEFAKAFRAMQLESSVFAICVIQLKPQLERLLDLPESSLTKEIQLTQDLMSLFVEYQIPSDLLSYEGADTPDPRDKVVAVKGYVKSVMDVINGERKKNLEDEKMKADMRRALYAPSPMMLGSVVGSAHHQRSRRHELDDDDLKGSRGCRGSRRSERSWSARFDTENAISSTSVSTGMETLSCGGDTNTDAADAPHSETPASSDDKQQQVLLNTVLSDLPKVALCEDFTAIPKLLDAKLEKYDTDNALHSTTVTASQMWTLRRQANLLTSANSVAFDAMGTKTEKKKAFDLLDAISRSGTLPIDCCELHVVIAISHCFENDVMGTVLQDNINPIAKVEKSSMMLASTIHGVPAPRLLASERDVERLTASFPELMEASGERQAD